MSRLAVVVLLLLAACGQAGGSTQPDAVATVYPLQWLVAQIAPDLAVTSLDARGQDPHDMELTPQQRASVERASLVVYLGDIDFQPQVEQAVAGATGAVVSAADVIGRRRLLSTGDQGVDPHLWFDPALLADVAVAVGDAVAETDPEQAEQYRSNAQRLAHELRDLAADVQTTLRDCAHDEVIVGHEAFAYLLTPNGLTQRGISGAGGHSEASPHDVAELAATIKREGLPAVLSEPVEGREDAEAVAREAGVKVLPVYSLDIVDDAQRAKGYPTLLREQADAVAAAAECR